MFCFQAVSLPSSTRLCDQLEPDKRREICCKTIHSWITPNCESPQKRRSRTPATSQTYFEELLPTERFRLFERKRTPQRNWTGFPAESSKNQPSDENPNHPNSGRTDHADHSLVGSSRLFARVEWLQSTESARCNHHGIHWCVLQEEGTHFNKTLNHKREGTSDPTQLYRQHLKLAHLDSKLQDKGVGRDSPQFIQLTLGQSSNQICLISFITNKDNCTQMSFILPYKYIAKYQSSHSESSEISWPESFFES